MQKEKYLGIYKIGSNRLAGWDYSKNGKYFITIKTQNKINYFGHIKNNKMILNDFGKIAYNEWKISGQIRNEIEIETFIVMPNHLHGIVVLSNLENQMDPVLDPAEMHGRASQPGYQSLLLNHPKFYRKPKSISSFIAGYKSSVTTKINNFIDENPLILPQFDFNQKFNRKNRLWQTNYYDHIIRNEEGYKRIKYYIINNPIKHSKSIIE